MIDIHEVLSTERDCAQRRNAELCSKGCTLCDLKVQEDLLLAAYDDILLLLRKKEEGRLIELPFGVGDTLYYLDYVGYNNFPTIQAIVVLSQAQAMNLAFSPTHQYYLTLAEAQHELDSLNKIDKT